MSHFAAGMFRRASRVIAPIKVPVSKAWPGIKLPAFKSYMSAAERQKDLTSFSKGFQKFSKKAWTPSGDGFLQKGCEVEVHDYGVSPVTGTVMYTVNGVDYSTGLTRPMLIYNVEHLLSSFPAGFFDSRPEWSRVRWIDIEGLNGEIIQYFLRLNGCEYQYLFNNIVDTKQRSMGLVVESPDSIALNRKQSKYLMVTKVPWLTDRAQTWSSHRDVRRMLDEKHIEYEQISHLLKLDEPEGRSGMLISFQEGIRSAPCDGVFNEIRQMIRSKDGVIHHRGGAHLLMQMVRASVESAVTIEHYIQEFLDDLHIEMAKRPDDLNLFNLAKQVEGECMTLRRLMEPLSETVSDLTSPASTVPPAVMGLSISAWRSIVVQQKRLRENITGEEERALDLIETYRDELAKREEQRQKRIEASQRVLSLVLSIFSPLSFIAGIYGMNFQNADGSPGIPELTWDASNSIITGYSFFWVICFTMTVSTMYLYKRMGLLKVAHLMKKQTVKDYPEVFAHTAHYVPGGSHPGVGYTAGVIKGQQRAFVKAKPRPFEMF